MKNIVRTGKISALALSISALMACGGGGGGGGGSDVALDNVETNTNVTTIDNSSVINEPASGNPDGGEVESGTTTRYRYDFGADYENGTIYRYDFDDLSVTDVITDPNATEIHRRTLSLDYINIGALSDKLITIENSSFVVLDRTTGSKSILRGTPAVNVCAINVTTDTVDEYNLVLGTLAGANEVCDYGGDDITVNIRYWLTSDDNAVISIDQNIHEIDDMHDAYGRTIVIAGKNLGAGASIDFLDKELNPKNQLAINNNAQL